MCMTMICKCDCYFVFAEFDCLALVAFTALPQHKIVSQTSWFVAFLRFFLKHQKRSLRGFSTGQRPTNSPLWFKSSSASLWIRWYLICWGSTVSLEVAVALCEMLVAQGLLWTFTLTVIAVLWFLMLVKCLSINREAVEQSSTKMISCTNTRVANQKLCSRYLSKFKLHF